VRLRTASTTTVGSDTRHFDAFPFAVTTIAMGLQCTPPSTDRRAIIEVKFWIPAEVVGVPRGRSTENRRARRERAELAHHFESEPPINTSNTCAKGPLWPESVTPWRAAWSHGFSPWAECAIGKHESPVKHRPAATDSSDPSGCKAVAGILMHGNPASPCVYNRVGGERSRGAERSAGHTQPKSKQISEGYIA
jgi:hypothetical protein